MFGYDDSVAEVYKAWTLIYSLEDMWPWGREGGILMQEYTFRANYHVTVHRESVDTLVVAAAKS